MAIHHRPAIGEERPTNIHENARSADFTAYRERQPIAAAWRRVRGELHEASRSGVGFVYGMADQHARLLWVDGDPATRRVSDTINFVAGSDWSARVAGPNPIDAAMRSGCPVRQRLTSAGSGAACAYACICAPIVDQVTGAALGTLTIGGRGAEMSSPLTVKAVDATAAMVQSMLATASRVTAPGRHRLLLLDHPMPTLLHPDGVLAPLSRRHGDLLLALLDHPDGLGTADLARLAFPGVVDPVTVRAEVSRLRRHLPEGAITSRPYRLTIPMSIDVGQVRGLVAADRATEALALLRRGGALADSEAPHTRDALAQVAESISRSVESSRDAVAARIWRRHPLRLHCPAEAD